MADETRRPDGGQPRGWDAMRPPPIDRAAERQRQREALAAAIFPALIASPHRAESTSGEDAAASFVLADAWLKERDRQRPAPVGNARASGLDASGSIELDPSKRLAPFTDQVWAIFPAGGGKPLMSGPATPLMFRRRELAEAAIRETSPSAWVAVAVELTLGPLP